MIEPSSSEDEVEKKDDYYLFYIFEKRKIEFQMEKVLLQFAPINFNFITTYPASILLQFFVFLFLQEKHAREEEERKRRIQLYVYVLRCIAYNFNAKQPNDMQKRHLKVTKEGHERMKARIEVSLQVVDHYYTFIKFLKTSSTAAENFG